MSELIKFIGDKPFEEIKDLLSPLKIQVKHTKNLYILNFLNDADFNDTKVRQASGIILEKNTNKIVHYSFEKCYDGLDDWSGSCTSKDPYSISKLNKNNSSIELYFEGSLIKLFYYDEKWNIATSKHIEAEKNFWTSKKSFSTLFKEAVSTSYNTEYSNFEESLDKKCSHTFLLQHPDNKMITNVGKEVVYYVNKVDLETLKEERPEKNFLTVSKTIDDVLKDKTQNYMIFKINEDNSTTRIKILTNNFTNMLELRGKYPDIGLSYLSNINNEEIKMKYINFFPEFYNKFLIIDKFFSKTVKLIHTLYIKIYAEKTELSIPENLSRTINQLHGQYKKTKKPIRYEDVYNKLTSLDPKIIAFVIGYKY